MYEFIAVELNYNKIELIFYKRLDNGLIEIKRVPYLEVNDELTASDELNDFLDHIQMNVTNFLNLN